VNWLGFSSPKWRIMCRQVGRKPLLLTTLTTTSTAWSCYCWQHCRHRRKFSRQRAANWLGCTMYPPRLPCLMWYYTNCRIRYTIAQNTEKNTGFCFCSSVGNCDITYVSVATVSAEADSNAQCTREQIIHIMLLFASQLKNLENYATTL